MNPLSSRARKLSALLVALVLAMGLTPGAAASAAARRPPAREPIVNVTLTTHSLKDALKAMPGERFAPGIAGPTATLRVDDARRYQRIIGFGAAMTDSSAWLLHDELSPAQRARVMRLLFSASTGIHLNLIRVPMGASDFSANQVPYSYDDIPAGQRDPTLQHFSVAHDRAYIVPALREMLSIDPSVNVLSTEWSPPPWMKKNQAFDNLGQGGSLIPADYQPLADYFVRFIQAYQALGIPIWAITPENEPYAPSAYPGMNLSPASEGQFVSQNLAPALSLAGLHTRIFGADDVAALWYGAKLMRTSAAPDLSGMAWHCYGGAQVMSQFHALHPNERELMSECSPGIVPYRAAEIAISGLRNWAAGIDLWNLALDPHGGPVQPPNSGCRQCSGLVTVNERSHRATEGLDYYELGQFSRFVQPGAVRIATARWVTDFRTAVGRYGVTSGLDNVAFINPGGGHVLIAYDNSRRPITFAVAWRGHHITYTLPPSATVTFTWK